MKKTCTPAPQLRMHVCTQRLTGYYQLKKNTRIATLQPCPVWIHNSALLGLV
jgi:hypothetical protein